MTDFNGEQATYWFDQSCRKAELIGGIDAYVDATRDGALTPDDAIARIGQLLDDFHTESSRPRGGTR
jgi:hypothetical protein